VRRPDRGESHSEEVQGHAQDGLSHGDVEVFDDELNACGVTGDAKCPAEVLIAVSFIACEKSFTGYVLTPTLRKGSRTAKRRSFGEAARPLDCQDRSATKNGTRSRWPSVA
jgi:hypothetical protein